MPTAAVAGPGRRLRHPRQRRTGVDDQRYRSRARRLGHAGSSHFARVHGHHLRQPRRRRNRARPRSQTVRDPSVRRRCRRIARCARDRIRAHRRSVDGRVHRAGVRHLAPGTNPQHVTIICSWPQVDPWLDELWEQWEHLFRALGPVEWSRTTWLWVFTHRAYRDPGFLDGLACGSRIEPTQANAGDVPAPVARRANLRRARPAWRHYRAGPRHLRRGRHLHSASLFGRRSPPRFPDAKLSVMPGVGHGMFWEATDAFNELVLEFIRRAWDPAERRRSPNQWKTKILGSTIVFAPLSLDQALEGLAEAGYTHCEVGAVKGWFEHIDPDTASDKDIGHAEAKLKETGSDARQHERPHPAPDRRGQSALHPLPRNRRVPRRADRQHLHRRCQPPTRSAKPTSRTWRTSATTPKNLVSRSGWRRTATCSRPRKSVWRSSTGSTVRIRSDSTTTRAMSSTTPARTPSRTSRTRSRAWSTFISRTRSAERAFSTSRRPETASSTYA